MANTLSDRMTNLLARPVVLNPHEQVRFKRCSTAVAAADADARVYPVERFRATDRILALWVGNDAITAGTDWDLGLYVAGDWSTADQTVVDKDIYVDGVSMATARNVPIDTAQILAGGIGSMLNLLGNAPGGGTITGILWARQLWQDAGLSAQGAEQYDLCWTANTVGSGAGTILTGILYATGQ